MRLKDWKNSVFQYLKDSGYKNPESLMSKHTNLLNYFYIKKVMPEDVNLFFGDNMKRLSTEDYMEILRAKKSSGGANYADSMVYYKGKVLGRCPKGTVKTGKTCAPSADAQKFTKYKPGDLGGISNKQIKKLSKAKTIDDIINAHKEENKQND